MIFYLIAYFLAFGQPDNRSCRSEFLSSADTKHIRIIDHRKYKVRSPAEVGKEYEQERNIRRLEVDRVILSMKEEMEMAAKEMARAKAEMAKAHEEMQKAKLDAHQSKADMAKALAEMVEAQKIVQNAFR